MRVRFVFHKGKDSWLGRAIVAYTWLLAVVRLDFKSLKYNFDHVSVWFPDEDGEFKSELTPFYPCLKHKGCLQHWTHPCEGCGRIGGSPYLGECFSSTTRGNAKGVRFAPASEVLHHPDRWMYQEYEVGENLPLVKETMKKYVGSKYDFAGIAGFFSPINTEVKEKWYCSEICAYIAWMLVLIEGKERIKRISPRRLAKVLGGELHELKCS